MDEGRAEIIVWALKIAGTRGRRITWLEKEELVNHNLGI
jgi:hypothetical protein